MKLTYEELVYAITSNWRTVDIDRDGRVIDRCHFCGKEQWENFDPITDPHHHEINCIVYRLTNENQNQVPEN